MRTVALISVDGSIDWCCFPHFDSPSLFDALLDDQRGGRFKIAPSDEHVRQKQFYWPDTNVLLARFMSDDGVAEIEDFMPAGIADGPEWHDQIVRRVRLVRGGEALGNFPQAFTHLGLISAAFNLDRALSSKF